MRHLGIFAVLMSLAVAASASEMTTTADTFSAVAYFTSGVVDGEPVDQIDTASLDQDKIVLYVDWEKMKIRAYRTEVRILDPNGEMIGKVRIPLKAGNGRHYTYYYYRPSPEDTPGDWTYQVYVDGRNAFEARIPVLAGE